MSGTRQVMDISVLVRELEGGEGREAARHVLYFFGEPEGYEPGGFTTALLHAMSKADKGNFDKLRSVFPTLGLMFDLAKNQASGMETVKYYALRGDSKGV